MKNSWCSFRFGPLHQTHSRGFRRFALSLLAGFLLLSAPAAQAQFALHTDLSDEAIDRIQEMEDVDSGSLYRVLSEHLRLSYEGERPVEARLVVFVATSDGGLQGSFSSEPFEMEPGARMRGEAIPEEDFLSLLDESRFNTYGTGAFMVSLDPVSASDVAYEFEDAWREGEDSWNPEYEHAWSQAFSNGIQGSNVKGALGGWHAALGLALVPIIGRYTDGDASEIKVRYIAALKPHAERQD